MCGELDLVSKDSLCLCHAVHVIGLVVQRNGLLAGKQHDYHIDRRTIKITGVRAHPLAMVSERHAPTYHRRHFIIEHPQSYRTKQNWR